MLSWKLQSELGPAIGEVGAVFFDYRKALNFDSVPHRLLSYHYRALQIMLAKF